MKVVKNIIKTYTLELNEIEFQDLKEMVVLNNDIYNDYILSDDEVDAWEDNRITHEYAKRVKERVSKIGNITSHEILHELCEVK